MASQSDSTRCPGLWLDRALAIVNIVVTALSILVMLAA